LSVATTMILSQLLSAFAAAPIVNAASELDSAASNEFRFDATASLALPQAVDMEQSSPETAEPFGFAGSEYIIYNAGYGSDFKDHQLARAGFGIGYFMDDDLSIDLDFNALYFEQDLGEDTFGGSINLLLRWHFFHDDERTWSVYGDAGAGLMLTSEKVPSNGSRFNFTPQIGAGISFDIGGEARMFTGVRWHHVSNANVYDENPGIDFLLIYAAIAFPF
jgi:lipid A 3-O-deacylase